MVKSDLLLQAVKMPRYCSLINIKPSTFNYKVGGVGGMMGEDHKQRENYRPRYCTEKKFLCRAKTFLNQGWT